MRIDFESLPDSARIWTFGVQRALTQAEQDDLLAAVDGFLDDWIAHGTPLQGARDWRHGRLLLVGVDEDAAPPSGCSIDALVHSLKAMESTLGTRIVDNSRVWYMEGGDVAWATRAQFKALAEAGTVTEATTVFDPTLTRMAELRAGRWELPAGQSWHGRAFFNRGSPASG